MGWPLDWARAEIDQNFEYIKVWIKINGEEDWIRLKNLFCVCVCQCIGGCVHVSCEFVEMGLCVGKCSFHSIYTLGWNSPKFANLHLLQ